jgi:hypothetical protein
MSEYGYRLYIKDGGFEWFQTQEEAEVRAQELAPRETAVWDADCSYECDPKPLWKSERLN